MDDLDYNAWRDSMRRLTREIETNFELRFGYPPDVQYVGGPTSQEDIDEAQAQIVALPEELLRFYAHISEVSLPDVDSGYFIHSLRRVLDGRARADPIRIGAQWNLRISAFGSDGGGTLYALGSGDGGPGPVYALAPGPVRDQVYEDELGAVRLADDFNQFLLWLHAKTATFLGDS
ncbi:SMI1/KNR4 family protein [Micromonospora sp. NPDC023737]|uniref:SMI1/KNR4 family protein n=1 Tax=unclassified Micromonospora TaxID=2617518 RepID=UPI0033F3B163